jgi:RHS repeat-associated protein
VALSRPDSLGVPRDGAWVPTDDPARRSGLDANGALFAGGRWTSAGLTALGHVLAINIATGGLTVAAVDLTMPYHSLSFQAVRTLDVQEQHAQQSYLDTHPNTDPRVHLFANWQSSREASVSAVCGTVLAELLVGDGSGDSGLYYRTYPDFGMNTVDGARVEERLRAYGVPGRTLDALGYRYEEFDAILRSRQGSFSVLAGDYRAETLVDPAQVRLVRFDVLSGMAFRYSSEFAYQELLDAYGARETTVQALVVDAVDPLGHRVSFAPVEPQPPYRAYRLSDGSGRALRFELDDPVEYLDGNRPGGVVHAYVVTRLVDETRSTDNEIAYVYEAGRLVEVSLPGHAGGLPRVYRYDYDDAGHIVRITDPVGDWFAIEYTEDLLDADERLMPRLKVARLLDADGNEARYAYDHVAGTVTVTFTGAAGDVRTVAYTYIEDATDTHQRYITSERVTVERGFSGSQLVETRWTYSADGRFRVEAITDALGNATRLDYNDFNQITRQVDAADHARDFAYDVHAGPTEADPNHYDLVEVSETNVDGTGASFPVRSQTSFERYDAATSADAADSAQSTHRARTRTNELGAIWRFDYDDATSFLSLRPTRTTDPLGKITSRAYDAAGSLVRETDAEGSTWEHSYNPQGQLIALRDPNDFRRTWVYDGGSRWLTAATDARGMAPGDPAHSVRYDYDDAGRRTRDVDPVGAVLEYAYLANRRLRSLTQQGAAGETTSFAYDASGALTEIQDPRGHTTFFGIDEAGRVYQSCRDDPTHPSLRTRFDAAGRPIELTDRNGQATTYTYDAVGRVVSIREPDWPADAPVHPGKQVAITYDALGRRLRVSDSELPRDHTYAYDAAGNLTAVGDPFGPPLQYTYDARNMLVGVHDGEGVLDLLFGRDGAGHLITVTDSAWLDPSRSFQLVRHEGALVGDLYRVESPSGLVARFAYDENRQLTQAAIAQAEATIATYGYEYRDDGLLGQATGDHAGLYDYDPVKRLTKETDAGMESAYDGAGNRLWRAAGAPIAGQANTYDAGNRLLFTPGDGTTYHYDDNGNLLLREPAGGEATAYEYDGANRLRQVTRSDFSIAYRYDADGRLLERERSVAGAVQSSRYLYANGAIAAELDGDSVVRALYTRADDGRLLRRRAVDGLNPVPSSDAHSLFYVHDGLGSVVRLLDWDGGTHLAVDYDAWGRGASQGAALGNPFRYRGGLEDADSGLLSFGRRWYDPTIGRWLTQDPLLAEVLMAWRAPISAVAELANLYLYVGANPLNLADPSGLGPVSWIEERLREIVIGFTLGKQKPDWKRGGQPEGTPTEQVERKAPAKTENQSEEQPVFEEGAGDGSHTTSKRIEAHIDGPDIFWWATGATVITAVSGAAAWLKAAAPEGAEGFALLVLAL